MSLRIAIVGMSTTGKSKVADEIKSDLAAPVPADTQIIDSDAWIAEQILGDNKKPGIGRVFLTLGRDEALKRIEAEENRFLQQFLNQPENAIFALGPWLGARANWKAFRPTVRLIKINKSADDVLEGLNWRRKERIKAELAENFADLAEHQQYGCWDVDVTVDAAYNELPKDKARQNVARIIGDMDRLYQDAIQVDYPVSAAQLYDLLELKAKV
jgi:shikimate kinase